MKRNTVFALHSSALTALFILGNGVVIFPIKGADEYNFLGYIIAGAVAFLLYLCAIPVINRLYAPKVCNKFYMKLIFTVIYLLTAVFALMLAVNTFMDFTLFAGDVLLHDFPLWVAVLLFLLTVLFFAFRRQEDFLKFALISFCFTAGVIIFFFIASFKRFNFDNIIILNIPDFGEIYPQIKNYIVNPLLSALLIGVYEVCVFKKVRKRNTFWGLGAGLILLGICILSSVLLFGARLSAVLDYPYASAISTVTIGRLFTRLDGFSYFVYFSACLTRITVCLYLVWTMLKRSDSLYTSK